MPHLPDIHLQRLAEIAVRPYRCEGLEQDQLGAARLAILQSEETEPSHLVKEARDAVVEMLRKEWGRKGQKRHLSLDAFPPWNEPDMFELCDRWIDYIPAEDQWEVTDLRMWARQAWATLCKISTKQELEVLWRWIWLGQTQAQMAHGMERHINRIYQLQVSSIARYRKREGIPKPESKTGAARRWHPGERWAERGKKGAAEAARRRNESRTGPQPDPSVEGDRGRSGGPREHLNDEGGRRLGDDH